MSSIVKTLDSIELKYPTKDRYRSYPLSNSKETTEYSQIYRHINVSEHEPLPQNFFHPELNTLSKIFKNSVQYFSNDDCLGHRELNGNNENKNSYKFFSYKEIEIRKNKIASGIIHCITTNPQYKQDTSYPDFIVSIFSPNRLEWILIDLATRDYSLPNTSLYSILGSSSSKYILETTKSPILFVDKDKIPLILKLKQNGGLVDLLYVVSFDDLQLNDNELVDQFNRLNIILIDLKKIEETGAKNLLPENYNPPTPDTTYTISFTSGTTGNPKGVVISNRSLLSSLVVIELGVNKPAFKLNEKSFRNNRDENGDQISTYCALPLAHIYERVIFNHSLSRGYKIGLISKGGPKFIFEDLKIIKPHIFCSVPRIHSRILEFLSKIFFNKFKIKENDLLTGNGDFNDNDILLIRKYLREKIGFDNVRLAVTGAAPLDSETIKILKDRLGIGFAVAYGSTEGSGAVSVGDAYLDEPNNSCGPISITSEIKIKDYSDLGYSIKDDPNFIKGELLIRGPQIFKEYYKNKEETDKNIDKDGFYHSGDIVKLQRSTGEIFVIDRIKNFFKLAQGEFITPEKVEIIYSAHNEGLISQIFIYGNSLRNYLVGIIGVTNENLLNIANLINIQPNKEDLSTGGLLEEINKIQNKRKLLILINKNLQDHNTTSSDSKLNSLEKLHNFILRIDPFKPTDGLVTPTFKFKRPQIIEFYKPILNELYNEGSLIKNSKL
ncbi:hypothetical protein WICMUC_002031 [Wickerhamomyces mucosus]|uniref:AMP-dependent synthetase/ligase domain-containing protein n=1 Tax=Wickerhamomyces mucosus TaxID=1378264 RepID=A0A9P8TF82_9ASCO|nr:hypothetical protein WICMUC_002031 [Wickerhamomyces mucosus]